MKLATLALALLSLFTTADVASAQAVECGKCQNSLQDISTVTTGGRTAGWVTISQKKGTCKARPGGPCSETEGCRGEFRIDIEGGQGGNSFYYTYKVWEVAHEVEFEDLPEEPKDSGSGTTGYNGNGDPIPIDASCDKKGVISLMVMGGQMSLTMKCDRCPTIAPDPF